jgi:hypothetical protein
MRERRCRVAGFFPDFASLNPGYSALLFTIK